MNKKIIIPVIVVIILVIVGLAYGLKGTATSSPTPTETPAPTSTPIPTEAPAPTPTATPEQAPTATPANTAETEEIVDKDSPEYIKKEYHQEGKTLNDGLKAQGVYQDEDGIFRWPDGDPVTFYDDSMLPEGFTYEASPEDNPNLMTEEEQQATKDANDGKNPKLNAVIDQLYKEGYFN